MSAVFTVVDWSKGSDDTWYCDAYKDRNGIVHIVAFGRMFEQPKETEHEEARSPAARDSDTIL